MRLRVCTWNIELGLRLGQVLEAIQSHDDFAMLDVLALQEASWRDGVEDAAAVAAALGEDYEYHQVATHLLGGLVQANALVWHRRRVAVDRVDCVRLPAVHEVRLPRAERALLGMLRAQPRTSVLLQGRRGNRTLTVYSAHLDVIGFQHKLAQLSRILDDGGSREATDVTVIAGDLNTFGIGSRPRWRGLMAAAAAEGFRDVTHSVGWTQSVSRLRLNQKLDAILVRSAAGLQAAAWTLEVPGSDHLPVFANIEI